MPEIDGSIVVTKRVMTIDDGIAMIAAYKNYYNIIDELLTTEGMKDKIFDFYITSGFAGQLIFLVKDIDSGLPLANVKPYIYLPTANGGFPTGDDGVSMLPLLPAGIYTLGLHKNTYRNMYSSFELFPNKITSVIFSMRHK